MAATLRALSCRRGTEQMRADADEAAQKFAAANFVPGVTPLLQGTARVPCGDLDGGDAFFADALGLEEERGAPDILAVTLCERSLAAMARGHWNHAEAFASRAHTRLRQAGIEDTYATPLVSAVQARAALHRGDVPAARRELISALRLRPLMTYAQPHWAVQTRIELIRVHLALDDLAGARRLMVEIDEILKRRPDLGTLIGRPTRSGRGSQESAVLIDAAAEGYRASSSSVRRRWRFPKIATMQAGRSAPGIVISKIQPSGAAAAKTTPLSRTPPQAPT